MSRDSHLGDKTTKNYKELISVKVRIVVSYWGQDSLCDVAHGRDFFGDWQSSISYLDGFNLIIIH